MAGSIGRFGSFTVAEQDATDRYYAQVLTKIEEHGWMVQAVMGLPDQPDVLSFCYTAGLALKGLPELYLIGLPIELGGAILNETAQQMVDTTVPVTNGQVLDLAYSTQFRVHGPIDAGQAEMFLAKRINEGSFVAMQVMWPDTEGRFPDEEGYDMDNYPQQVIEDGTDDGEHDSQEERLDQEAHG